MFGFRVITSMQNAINIHSWWTSFGIVVLGCTPHVFHTYLGFHLPFNFFSNLIVRYDIPQSFIVLRRNLNIQRTLKSSNATTSASALTTIKRFTAVIHLQPKFQERYTIKTFKKYHFRNRWKFWSGFGKSFQVFQDQFFKIFMQVLLKSVLVYPEARHYLNLSKNRNAVKGSFKIDFSTVLSFSGKQRF